MGRRSRQRERGQEAPSAPPVDYPDAEGNVLQLRPRLSAGARREYADTLRDGLDREDAWQRGVELLFERLAVSWMVNGVRASGPQELLGRYRMASTQERRFVRDALRAHLREHFPELPEP